MLGKVNKAVGRRLLEERISCNNLLVWVHKLKAIQPLKPCTTIFGVIYSIFIKIICKFIFYSSHRWTTILQTLNGIVNFLLHRSPCGDRGLV